MLGLQTLDELGFNERNDRYDTALPEKAPCTLRVDHEDAYHTHAGVTPKNIKYKIYHTLPWLNTTEKYTRVADNHPKNTMYYRGVPRWHVPELPITIQKIPFITMGLSTTVVA